MTGSYTCRWCRMTTAQTEDLGSCPTCGAPVDVRDRVTESGWYELPAVPDMARLQFGRSYCQIEGAYVPVADFNLSAEDGVYFTHHLLLWKDVGVAISPMAMRGGWSRLFAGLPLIMTEARGPGHVAFSRDVSGEVVPVPLQQGMAVDVREHIFMVATHQVRYDWFNTGVWFQTRDGDDTDTHYPIGMYMDRFSAPGAPGLLLLHAAGNAFVRQLAPGESLLIKPTSLLFKDSTVQMHLHFEHPAGTWRSWRSWGDRFIWLRLTGPGRVSVHSAYDTFEDSGNNMVGSSPATRYQWRG